MSDTGRYFIKKGGRTFVVEPIDITQGKGREKWGDVNPSTHKIEGSYGNKHLGSIQEEESIIKKENGFKNIIMLEVGESPDSYIEKLLNET